MQPQDPAPREPRARCALWTLRAPSPVRYMLEHEGRYAALDAWLARGGASSAEERLAELCAGDGAALLALAQSAALPECADPRASAAGVDLPWRPAPTGKVLALGKNFRAHAEEFGEQTPEEPLFFAKLPETLVPHGARVRVPAWYDGRVDHEAELAVVIGREGRALAPEKALAHVAGYCVANDLTARSLQGRDRKLGHPWLRSKNLEDFAPIGPCFVPRAALALEALELGARVIHADGSVEERQRANTRELVVGVPEALAWLSRHLPLRAGDLVLMGTPAGVGPLVHGDRVECWVEGIGTLVTHIERP